MSTTAIVLILVAAIMIAVIAWMYYRTERSKKLKSRFGPEYDQAVNTYGSSPKAEAALSERQERMKKLNIRSLTPAERDRFAAQWHDVQAMFVDDPSRTIEKDDQLVCEVMQTRGYLMSDFDGRAEDLSVDHPAVVQNYRAGHAIALRRERWEATTEDLRKAFVYYRDLFDELLETHVTEPATRR